MLHSLCVSVLLKKINARGIFRNFVMPVAFQNEELDQKIIKEKNAKIDILTY
jgi:hypothetical protein